MRMSDILEDPAGDQLSFVGLMPEDLPFEIHERPEKKDGASQEDAEEFWDRQLPDAIIGSQRSDKDDQEQWRVVYDKKCPEFFWWFVMEHSF